MVCFKNNLASLIAFFAVALFLASPLRATSLSDLDEVVDSNGGISTLLSNKAKWAFYERNLKNYLGEENLNCTKFDDAKKTLGDLNGKLPHYTERLAKESAPEIFHYNDKSQKPVFTLRRITRAFHSLWMYPIRNECKFSLCTERDNLLVDRWTSGLIGVQNFALEKNGKYAGVTVTIVPVQKHKDRGLFIIPLELRPILNTVLDEKRTTLHDAIMRDLIKKFPGQKLFVVRAKSANAKGFSAYDLSSDGHTQGPLTNIDEYRLSDPAASTVASLIVNACQGEKGTVVGVDPQSTAVGSDGGTVKAGGLKISNTLTGPGGAKSGAGAAGGLQNLQAGSNTKPGNTKSTETASRFTVPTKENNSVPGAKGTTIDSPSVQTTVPSRMAKQSSADGNQNYARSNFPSTSQNRAADGDFSNPTTPNFGNGGSGNSANGGGTPSGNSYNPTINTNSASTGPRGSDGSTGSSKPDSRNLASGSNGGNSSVDFPGSQKGQNAENGKDSNGSNNPKDHDAKNEKFAQKYFEKGNEYGVIKTSLNEARQMTEKEKDELRQFLANTDEMCEHCKNCAFCKQKNRTGSFQKEIESGFSFISGKFITEAFATSRQPTSEIHSLDTPSSPSTDHKRYEAGSKNSPFATNKFAGCVPEEEQPSNTGSQEHLFYAWVDVEKTPEDEDHISPHYKFSATTLKGAPAECRVVRTNPAGDTVIGMLRPTKKSPTNNPQFTAINGIRLGENYQPELKYCLWPSKKPTWVPCPCKLQDTPEDQYAMLDAEVFLGRTRSRTEDDSDKASRADDQISLVPGGDQ